MPDLARGDDAVDGEYDGKKRKHHDVSNDNDQEHDAVDEEHDGKDSKRRKKRIKINFSYP